MRRHAQESRPVFTKGASCLPLTQSLIPRARHPAFLGVGETWLLWDGARVGGQVRTNPCQAWSATCSGPAAKVFSPRSLSTLPIKQRRRKARRPAAVNYPRPRCSADAEVVSIQSGRMFRSARNCEHRARTLFGRGINPRIDRKCASCNCSRLRLRRTQIKNPVRGKCRLPLRLRSKRCATLDLSRRIAHG